MSGPCGADGVQQEQKPRVLRNGMDYEPKKTYPPDYSNVPSVRDWQMSPFSNERFDLDEIQRAEKKGMKGKQELEKLRKMYPWVKLDGDPPPAEEDSCASDSDKKEDTKKKAEEKPRETTRVPCSSEYLYQPYGPLVVSSLSYSRPETNKPRLYSYMGPSHYAGFRFKVPAPETYSIIPCPELQEFSGPSRLRSYKDYVPYGPHAEYRITPDMYTPMGPSPRRVK